ncbi:MAG: hypothetical protein JWM87_2591 [Candidatus Eremiobacteraeota bacterium]|nr:hypothetical protein [Candidatus Eremiobacteraeota bacterium]
MSLRESYYEKLQPVIDYLTTNREPSATRDFHQTLLAGAAHHARWEHETYVKGGEDAKINPVFTVADEPFDFAGEANRALERACKYEADVRAIALP